MSKLSIIIVNWNGLRHLKACINSVISQTYRDFNIILVDNNSSDGSIGFIDSNYKEQIKSKKIILIKNNKNSGFAEGNNIGIRYAMKDKGMKYVVLLNNDTIVHKDWLKELIKTAETKKEIGMVSPKAYLADKKTIDTLGLRMGWLGISRDIKKESYIHKLFCPSGVSALYKRKLLEDIRYKDEYFDKDFFMYCEDLDLGYRAINKAWKPAYSKKSVVYHIHGASSKQSKLPIYYLHRNNVWVIVKNYESWRLLLLSPLLILLHLFIILYHTLKGNGITILKAKFHAITHINKILKKRYF